MNVLGEGGRALIGSAHRIESALQERFHFQRRENVRAVSPAHAATRRLASAQTDRESRWVYPSTRFGEELAIAAKAEAASRAKSGNRGGACFEAVDRSVARVFGWPTTPFLKGLEAYKAANELARVPRYFTEVQVSPKNLSKLPPGAIVVWGWSPRSPDGHISIADGNGNEISDFIYPQMTDLRGYQNFRVFIPRNIL